MNLTDKGRYYAISSAFQSLIIALAASVILVAVQMGEGSYWPIMDLVRAPAVVALMLSTAAGVLIVALMEKVGDQGIVQARQAYLLNWMALVSFVLVISAGLLFAALTGHSRIPLVGASVAFAIIVHQSWRVATAIPFVGHEVPRQ